MHQALFGAKETKLKTQDSQKFSRTHSPTGNNSPHVCLSKSDFLFKMNVGPMLTGPGCVWGGSGRATQRTESPQLPALHLHSRIKSVAPVKFTFPLRSDSVTDFLGKSCYLCFSAEKMETKKRSRDLPSSQRQDVAKPRSQARLPDSHPSISLSCSEASQEEEGCCDGRGPRLPRHEHGPGPPACLCVNCYSGS